MGARRLSFTPSPAELPAPLLRGLRAVSSVSPNSTSSNITTAAYTSVAEESVNITFDPSQISYGQILMIFFSVAHDPTQLNRQGPDDGTQYRSAIFYSNEEQRRIATAYIGQLDAAKVYPRKIVTEVAPFKAFFRAEEYHQDYLQTHADQPYIVYNDLPKLDRLKKQFPEMYH